MTLPEPHNLAKYKTIYLDVLSLDTEEVIPPMYSLFQPSYAMKLVDTMATELDAHKQKDIIFHIFSSNGYGSSVSSLITYKLLPLLVIAANYHQQLSASFRLHQGRNL